MRIVWATLAVLAIIAMHGLATHASAPEAAGAATATHSGHASGHASAHGSAEPASHGEHGHEATVLGLCLAMLASAGILLLRVVRPRRGLLALLERARLTPSYPVAVAGGAPPPDLHALSILRC